MTGRSKSYIILEEEACVEFRNFVLDENIVKSLVFILFLAEKII